MDVDQIDVDDSNVISRIEFHGSEQAAASLWRAFKGSAKDGVISLSGEVVIGDDGGLEADGSFGVINGPRFLIGGKKRHSDMVLHPYSEECLGAIAGFARQHGIECVRRASAPQGVAVFDVSFRNDYPVEERLYPHLAD